jgi:hypothetical protein
MARKPDRLTQRWIDQRERFPNPPSSRARIVREPQPRQVLNDEAPWEVIDRGEAEYPLPVEPAHIQNRARQMIALMRSDLYQEIRNGTGNEFKEALDRASNPESIQAILNEYSNWKRLSATPATPARTVTVEFDDSSVRIQARATERPPGYWKLRNGKFIAIGEMDQQHLENCIRMCERNAQARGRRVDPNVGVYAELRAEALRRREQREQMERTYRWGGMFIGLDRQRQIVPRPEQNEQNPEPEIIAPPADAPKRRVKKS